MMLLGSKGWGANEFRSFSVTGEHGPWTGPGQKVLPWPYVPTTDLPTLLQTAFLAELVLCHGSVTRGWSPLPKGLGAVKSSLPRTRAKTSSWPACWSQHGARGHSLALHTGTNFILYFDPYYLILQLYLMMCFILYAVLLYDCSLGWINLSLVHHVLKAFLFPC